MPERTFPYGKETIVYEIDDERYAGSLVSKLHSYRSPKEERELVRESLMNPVGTSRLSDLSVGKNKIVIIASDHTRPVPSKVIIPELLAEIRKGNPEADITILIATGCHRSPTKEELISKFGENIYNAEKIVVHDCDDTDNLVNIGTLPSGGELIINRLAAECDLLVSEGFIEPHFFAGFSGGRKSVLPGIASRKTVVYNHNAHFIEHCNARTGKLTHNPIHEDMLYAAKTAKLSFICNVVLNSEKKVVFAASGDCEKAHKEGCNFLVQLCGVKAIPADIVISTNGGYPLDQNIYQSVKGMTAAEATVRKGGVIIMLSKCNDGHGGESFYNTFHKTKDLNALMQEFHNTPANETIIDQWQSQIFARVLLHATVVFISDAPDEMIRELKMIPAHTLEGALAIADEILKKKGIESGKIVDIPDGVSVIVE
mgnify:FL=1